MLSHAAPRDSHNSRSAHAVRKTTAVAQRPTSSRHHQPSSRAVSSRYECRASANFGAEPAIDTRRQTRGRTFTSQLVTTPAWPAKIRNYGSCVYREVNCARTAEASLHLELGIEARSRAASAGLWYARSSASTISKNVSSVTPGPTSVRAPETDQAVPWDVTFRLEFPKKMVRGRFTTFLFILSGCAVPVPLSCPPAEREAGESPASHHGLLRMAKTRRPRGSAP